MTAIMYIRIPSRTRVGSLLAFTAIAGVCACGGGDPERTSADMAREPLAATASATTVHRIATRDKFAYANYFESTNNCESTSIEVFALKSSIRSNGAASQESLVRAQATTYDACTGMSGFISGAATPVALYFRNDLTHVTVKATVVLDDFQGTTKTLAIDLAWDGGVLTADKSKLVTVTPTSRTVIKTEARIRQSETVAGTLMLDSTDLLAAGRPVMNRFTTGYVTGSGGSTIEIIRDR